MSNRSAFRPAARAAGAALLVAAPLALAAAVPDQRLSFDVQEGRNLNSFLRAGPVATHLLLRSGRDPRILVAFPAGNSGVGLWFAHTRRPVVWTLRGRPEPIVANDDRGRPLYGMAAEVTVAGAELAVKEVVLSSVRVLRDYQMLGTVASEVATHSSIQGRTITWLRDRLDGAAGYRLSLEVTDGELQSGHITAGSDGKVEMKVTALSGETPLTALSGKDLLNLRGRADPLARNALTFLSYQEKFLAGSWRFNTYFGRDTLMSVRLLMPALTPSAVEAGLRAVLTRLSPKGEVAHEEDIGEFAVLEHLRASGTRSAAPVFNYNMIDGDFMLAPVARAWLLEDARGRAGAVAFLARLAGRNGEAPRAAGADLLMNLRLVIQRAAAFAADPQVAHLIGLKAGLRAGQWRDSNEGLGRGRYPYDVNGVLVPAALDAASRFYVSGLLDPYLGTADRVLFSRAGAMAKIWRTEAGPLFEVNEPNETARQSVKAYAASLGVLPDAALSSLGNDPVGFHAISLDEAGKAVPVVNSDEGFELLFGLPSAAALDRAVAAIMRPFPAGLLTDVGVVVANPVFATPEVQARFTNNAYHGTVVWSWQQAVLAAGVERQLQRSDLPKPVKARMRIAQQRLWHAIDAGKAVRNSELWSWTYEGGHFQVAPYGASGADADESNAAQLWSTVYLAIHGPGSPSR